MSYSNSSRIFSLNLAQSINNKLIVEKCESSIQDNVGYINHIHILPKFRNKKLGSKLLKKTEDTIKNDFNVNKINILSEKIYHQKGSLYSKIQVLHSMNFCHKKHVF